MKKKISLALAILFSLGAIGLWTANHYFFGDGAQRLAEAFNQALPEGTRLTYQSASGSLLTRTLTLQQLQFSWTDPIRGPLVLKAPIATLSGMPSYDGASLSLSGFKAENLTVSESGAALESLIHLSSIDISAPVLPLISSAFDKAAFDTLSVSGVDLHNKVWRLGGSGPACSIHLDEANFTKLTPPLALTKGTVKGLQAKCQEFSSSEVWSIESISGHKLSMAHFMPPYDSKWATALTKNPPEKMLLTHAVVNSNGMQIGGFDKFEASTKILTPNPPEVFLEANSLRIPTAGLDQILRGLNIDVDLPALVSADMLSSFVFNPEKKELSFKLNKLDVDQLFAISSDFRLANITGMITTPAQLALVALGPTKIAFTDKGLVRSSLAQKASELQMRPEVYVDQLFAAHPLHLEGNTDGNKRIQQVYRAAHGFLLNPGTFELTIAPQKPISMLALFLAARSNGEALMTSLNVFARASN